jgi:hypothetical protein
MEQLAALPVLHHQFIGPAWQVPKDRSMKADTGPLARGDDNENGKD